MEFREMQSKARVVREQYAQREMARYGRSWTHEELMLGFLGDVGDLAKLVQGKAGVRPREGLDEALAHELADCLWSVMSLADTYGVDLEAAFDRTMDELSAHLASADARPDVRVDTDTYGGTDTATATATNTDVRVTPRDECADGAPPGPES